MVAKFNYFIASAHLAQSITDSAFHYFRVAERTADLAHANAILDDRFTID